jgi:hypothetical protein
VCAQDHIKTFIVDPIWEWGKKWITLELGIPSRSAVKLDIQRLFINPAKIAAGLMIYFPVVSQQVSKLL